MKKKGIIAILACVVLAAGATLGMTACTNKNKGITVWASQDEQATLTKMIAQFKEDNPDFKTPISQGVVGAADAVSKLSTDATVGADVYCYANDQLVELLTYSALAPLNAGVVEKLKEENDANSVEAGLFNGRYYGYPYAADNGYFLYYNKGIMTEEQAQTLEGITAACTAAGKYFIYNMPEAWYTGAFFLGTGENCVGGTYTVEYEGKVVSKSYTNFGEKVAGSEYTIAQVGTQAMIELNAKRTDCYISGGDTEISTYLNGKNGVTWFGACVSGTWNAKAIQEKLGDDYAATKLPTFHSSLTGDDYQMGSLTGYKLFGVNPNSKHLAEAHQLAAYLSSEKMQELRYDDLQTGPSNKVVAQLEKVQQNVALAALVAQAPYATMQGAFPSKYWDAMKGLGGNVEGAKPKITTVTVSADDKSMTEALKAFVKNFEEGMDE